MRSAARLFCYAEFTIVSRPLFLACILDCQILFCKKKLFFSLFFFQINIGFVCFSFWCSWKMFGFNVGENHAQEESGFIKDLFYVSNLDLFHGPFRANNSSSSSTEY